MGKKKHTETRWRPSWMSVNAAWCRNVSPAQMWCGTFCPDSSGTQRPHPKTTTPPKKKVIISAFQITQWEKVSVEKNSGTPPACHSTGLRYSKKKNLLNGWTLICTLVVSGQWKQCSDRLMKIEMLNAAKRDTLKRGSLFHEIGRVTQPTQKPPGTFFFYAFLLQLHTWAPHFF